MRRMISKVLKQYGVAAVLQHDGQEISLRIFFSPACPKAGTA
jgi:hypothetical protein